jgi:prevent-host-death family protein
MRKLQLREAKASLSAVVDRAAEGEACVITRHGKPEAVVVGYAEWERLSNVPSFGKLLMSAPEGVQDLPKRSKSRLRSADL